MIPPYIYSYYSIYFRLILNDDITCKNYAITNIEKVYDTASYFDVVAKTLYTYGNIANFVFNLQLYVNHIPKGTYLEFNTYTNAVDHILSYYATTIRLSLDCKVYTILQNGDSNNKFRIYLYFFDDYYEDPDTALPNADMVYLNFICFMVIIYMLKFIL